MGLLEGLFWSAVFEQEDAAERAMYRREVHRQRRIQELEAQERLRELQPTDQEVLTLYDILTYRELPRSVRDQRRRWLRLLEDGAMSRDQTVWLISRYRGLPLKESVR